MGLVSSVGLKGIPAYLKMCWRDGKKFHSTQRKKIMTKDEAYVTSTSTSHRKCQHKNGWYANVKFWIFTKRIYLCSNCGEIIYVK